MRWVERLEHMGDEKFFKRNTSNGGGLGVKGDDIKKVLNGQGVMWTDVFSWIGTIDGVM